MTLAGGTTPEPTIRGLRVDQPKIWRLEVFRNGHVEFALWGRERIAQKFNEAGPWELIAFAIAEYIQNFVDLIAEIQDQFTISDPYLVTVSIYHAANLCLFEHHRDSLGIAKPRSWKEGQNLMLPPRIYFAEQATDSVSQRLCDLFWNAFGYMRCPFFNANGKLALP